MRTLIAVVVSGLIACSGSSAGVHFNEGPPDPLGKIEGDACPAALPGVWKPMSTANAPPALLQSKVVWTGDKMIVLGGSGATGDILAGGVYDACHDAWTTMRADGGPSGKNLVQMSEPMWTGSKMILWSGLHLASHLYDPTANTWTEMSHDGEPSLRQGEVRLLMGRKLFVWGGVNRTAQGTIAEANGAVFDSDTNRWTPLPTQNQPKGRSVAGAAFTGSKIVIWGGSSGEVLTSYKDTRLLDGAIYDPALGTWSTIETSGAPTSGEQHALTWTGSAMIVWGRPSVSEKRSGPMSALLDLDRNRWSSLVASPDVGTLGASSGRSAWTGRELALFGSATSPVAGLLYDPAASLWRRMTAVAAPEFSIGALAKSGDRLLLQGSASSSYPQTDLRFALFDSVSNGWQAVPELTGRSFPTVVFTGKRILVWGGTRTEIDPNGRTGCENPPPNVGCDPVTPTKEIPLTNGFTYGL